jgi:hypothetical protein
MLIVNPYQDFDRDALDYIRRVEAADGAGLETGIKIAYNNFVRGCKKDGTWDSIKASCIMAGARTLAGALTPVVGPAPTNVNFVGGDYDRVIGLLGNGSNKYLNTNYRGNEQTGIDRHNAFYLSTPATTGCFVSVGDCGGPYSGYDFVDLNGSIRTASMAGPWFAGERISYIFPGFGFIGTSRSSSSAYVVRINSSSATVTYSTSATPQSLNYLVFSRRFEGAQPNYSVSSRMSYYSVGKSINLALLDNRVSTFMSEISATLS